MNPDDEQRPVRLVLDRSALLAWLAGSVHVAEPLQEVTDDGVRSGVTGVTVAETMAVVLDGKDRQRLYELLDSEICAVLDTHGWQWHELVYWRGVTGRADLATNVLACIEHDASILTGEGQRYGGGWGLPMIRISE